MPVHEEAWTVTTEVENVSKQIGHSVVPLLMALNRWPQILSEAGLDGASTSSTTFYDEIAMCFDFLFQFGGSRYF